MAVYVEIRDIVPLLLEDPVLIRKFHEFCGALKLKAPDVQKWDRGIKTTTMEYNEVFSQILENWIGLARNANRTVGKLCKHLIDINCRYAAENIEHRFGTESLVCVETPNLSFKQGKQPNAKGIPNTAAIKIEPKKYIATTLAVCCVLIGVVITIFIQFKPTLVLSNSVGLPSSGKTSLEDFITQNILELTASTNVNPTLLLSYVQSGVILDDVRERIDAEPTNQMKAATLYNQLKRSSETKLGLIIDGLKKSLNQKAIEIFNRFK